MVPPPPTCGEAKEVDAVPVHVVFGGQRLDHARDVGDVVTVAALLEVAARVTAVPRIRSDAEYSPRHSFACMTKSSKCYKQKQEQKAWTNHRLR
jgi:hypothetical protein